MRISVIGCGLWGGILLLLSCTVQATPAEEKMYLTQILNSLNELQPLVLAAKHAELPNARVQFHYQRYLDNNGEWHNGLLDDLALIKQGVVERLNETSTEPRTVIPLQGDYETKKHAGAAP